ASAGNPLVAEDNDGGPVGIGFDAQLAATLAASGTYTIVAANNNALRPRDPAAPDDEEEIVGYTLHVQKCANAGALRADAAPRSAAFNVFDCTGFGGVPFRSYVLDGTAGEFVTVSMSSDDVDAAV